MSDDGIPDPWWGDESPIGTHRRANGASRDGDLPGAGIGDRRPVREGYDGEARGGAALDGGTSRGAGYGAGSHRHASYDAAGGYDAGAGAGYRNGTGYEGGAGPGVGYDGGAAYEGGRGGVGYDDGAAPGAPPGPEAPPGEPPRSRAQIFVPPPEELPPFEEVAGPPRRSRAVVPADPPGAVPPAPVLAPGDVPAPRPVPDLPPAPDLAAPARPAPRRPSRPPIDRRRLAIVYDVDGPRIRLGLAWFAGAMAATLASSLTAALVFAVAAGFAARQLVRAWGSVPWQADVAAGIGAVPVLAALVGTPAVVATVVLGLMVAAGAAAAPDGARMAGPGGRTAAAVILGFALVPALAGALFVLVRGESVFAALVLLLVASAYEVGDYVVGSGASNPLEGPLAGITTATLVSLPLALVLVEPYDAAGVALLAFVAAACPVGQIAGSAVLPGAAAHAPALRRIDTLIVLAPIWAAAAGAF